MSALNAVEIVDQIDNTRPYIRFLIIRWYTRIALSSRDRVSRAPNRHIARTVNCDLCSPINYIIHAFDWKHAAIFLG